MTGLQEMYIHLEVKTIFRMQNLNIHYITVADSIWSKCQLQQQTTNKKKKTNSEEKQNKGSTFCIYFFFM